jgi:hypothetical protein
MTVLEAIAEIDSKWNDQDKVDLINSLIATMSSEAFRQVHEFVLEAAIDEAEINGGNDGSDN